MRINKITIFISLFLALVSCQQNHIRSIDYLYIKPIQLSDDIKVDNLQNTGMDTIQIITLTKLILSDTFPNIHSLLILKDNKLVYENYFSGNVELQQ